MKHSVSNSTMQVLLPSNAGFNSAPIGRLLRFSQALVLLLGMIILNPMPALSSSEGQPKEGYKFSPYLKHFSTEQGMPSTIVHEVFQDSKNNLWFCTENGISRYNGETFKNYGEAEGLCFNTALYGHEVDNGQIWFYTSLTQVFTYLPDEDRIVCHSFNDSLVSAFRQMQIQRLTSHGDTVIIVSLRKSMFKVIYDDEADSTTYFEFIEHERKPEFIRFGDDQVLFIGYYNAEHIRAITGIEGPLTDDVFFFRGANRPMAIRAGKNYAFSISRVLMLLDSNLNVIDYMVRPEEFIGHLFYREDRNSLWAGTLDDGVLEISLDDFEVKSAMLEGLGVTATCKDHEGGHWFSTVEGGVYYYPPNEVEYARPLPHLERIYTMHLGRINDTVAFLGTKHGELYSVSTTKPSELHLRYKGQKTIVDINPHRKEPDWLVIGTYKLPIIDLRTYEIIENDGGRFFFEDTTGQVFRFSGFNAKARIISEANDTTRINWDKYRIRISYKKDECSIYLVSHAGISIYNHCADTSTDVTFQGKVKNHLLVTGVLPFKGDTLLVVSASEGLFLMHEAELICQITTDNGLISNSCRGISTTDDGSYWVGTDLGVQRFRMDGCSLESIMQLRPETGYPFQLVKGLTALGDYLYVGTESNVFRTPLPKTPLNQAECNQLAVGQVYYHDQNVIPDDRGVFTFPSDFGTIIIELSNVCFTNSGSHLKRYRIAELDTNWTNIVESRLVVQGIPAGSYNLELQVMDLSGNWQHSAQPARIMVLEPFYLRWWFIFSVFVTLALVAGTVLYQRTVMVANNSRLQMGLLEANNRALGAQLNPHFLYNVLNTVGGSVARNDIRESLEVIGKFSSLMRRVFHNSRSDLISLEDEMKAVESYIELELLRLERGFDFTLLNSIPDQKGLHIPPLILQPLVENAIWHGIAESDVKGRLELEIRIEGELLCVCVKNSGKAADGRILERVERNRNSSLSVIVERLALLKKIYGNPTELSFSSNSEWATIATLKFPIILHPYD